MTKAIEVLKAELAVMQSQLKRAGKECKQVSPKAGTHWATAASQS